MSIEGPTEPRLGRKIDEDRPLKGDVPDPGGRIPYLPRLARRRLPLLSEVRPTAAKQFSLSRFDAPRSEIAGQPAKPGSSTPVGGPGKRLLDVSMAITVLALMLPLMLIIFILVRLGTGSRPIFAHRRIGFGGKPFLCYKFRTMHANAEERLQSLLESDPEAAREWRESRKLKSDPRITPLGRVLRRTSLDELPQIVNVLRGDMSCVGPRPIIEDELELYGPRACDYLNARPGITGLWQVSGRSNADYRRRVQLDSQYVREWSMAKDLVILARTVTAVLRYRDAC